MAHGDILFNDEEIRVWALLDAAGASSNGVWVDAGPMRTGAVLDVSGISGDSITLYGSNAETKPADATDGRDLNGAAIVADGIIQVGDLTRWVKAKFTFSAGAVTASLSASRS